MNEIYWKLVAATVLSLASHLMFPGLTAAQTEIGNFTDAVGSSSDFSLFSQATFTPSDSLAMSTIPTNYRPSVVTPVSSTQLGSRRSAFARRGLIGASPTAQPSLASVPDMFGDFFGGRFPGGKANNNLPPRGGVGTRSVKLAENLSPQPRSRVHASYHFFNDVFDGSFGDVNRYTVGVEFADQALTRSLDIRLPVAHTISNVQVNQELISKDLEIGNATLIYKQVLASGPGSLISGGLGVALPTASDGILLRPGDEAQILRVENDAVHFLPYLGFIKELGPRVFSQGFLQLDVDASGNEVFGDTNAINLRRLGVVQDPTLLFVDLGIGYRVFENRFDRFIHAMSVSTEIHYATTVQDTDSLPAGAFDVGDTTRRFDILNLTLGSNLEIGSSSLRPGVVVPLREGDDRQFDFELFLQFNLYF